MATNAYIGYTKKDNTIKVVKLLHDGYLDGVGLNLLEYFTTTDDVKNIVLSTIDYIDEDVFEFINEEDDEDFYVFEDSEAYLNEMNSDYCYLFDKDKWYVSKPSFFDFKELENIIDEEF